MRFAADWHSDTAHLAANEPLPAPELFARRVHDLLEQGEFAAALVSARVGTSRFPGYATGWFMRARSECRINDYEAALASTERCLALEPDFFAAWSLLETIYVQLGRLTAARAARQRLTEIQPRPEKPQPASPPDARPEVEAPRRQSLILVKPAATGSFETPTLAEMYRRQGLLDRALGVYRRILERHPDDIGAQAMVRKLEDELGSRRKAVETL